MELWRGEPDRAKFCSECATPLTGAPGRVAKERKVVSVLFVDLVGFTARSERADPEDVQATLAVYHEPSPAWVRLGRRR